jgi:hypothetical protein
MCVICVTPIEHLVMQRFLDCTGCETLTHIPRELTRLQALYCSACPQLTFIPDTLVELELLWCDKCPLLVSIPIVRTLRYLDCSECTFDTIPDELSHLHRLACTAMPHLKHIPRTYAHLIWLDCSHCPLLKEVPKECTQLEFLNCSDCSKLVTIPSPRACTWLEWIANVFRCRICVGADEHEWICDNCPWLTCNAHLFPAHHAAVQRIQHWFRAGHKQVFKRYVRTRAFNEWFFSPLAPGGRLHKQHLAIFLARARPPIERCDPRKCLPAKKNLCIRNGRSLFSKTNEKKKVLPTVCAHHAGVETEHVPFFGSDVHDYVLRPLDLRSALPLVADHSTLHEAPLGGV